MFRVYLHRIRTNYTAHPHGSLMLPISLEVTSQPLLFCPQQYLDFGVVDANDPPKTLKLFVINSGNRPITVQVFRRHHSLFLTEYFEV